MNRRRIYIILSFAIMLIMSMNLVISTLHSHHHFEWNHPDNFADTGQCITVDSTVCPIAGHLLKGNIASSPDIAQYFRRVRTVSVFKPTRNSGGSFFPVLGRSPPSPL